MNNLAPIVLFVYNRPDHTARTIEALQKNTLAFDSELFIYADAAKHESDQKQVDEVLELISNVSGFKNVILIKQYKNIGLANSIISGVTEIVNKYGRVIVLEDDLVTSPYFLKFMNDALDFYEETEKVWHISGYTPPINVSELDSHFFVKPTSCWGWATWKDRWGYFRKDCDYYLNKFTVTEIKEFNMDNSMDYHSHILQNKLSKINTWAIFWYATVFFNNGLSLHPHTSYVKNIGHDNSGVHCGSNIKFDIEFDFNSYPFPDFVEVSKIGYASFVDFYRKHKLPIYKKILRKVKRIFKK